MQSTNSLWVNKLILSYGGGGYVHGILGADNDYGEMSNIISSTIDLVHEI